MSEPEDRAQKEGQWNRSQVYVCWERTGKRRAAG